MPFNNIGFFAKRKGLGGVGGVTPAPSRDLVITPTLTNNAETISWTATSNMPEGTVLDFAITNLSNTDFTDGAVSGNITLNSSGGFTITRNIDRLANYSNTNVVFNLQVINPQSNIVLGESANAVVKPATPFVATGGVITTVDTAYTVHTYTLTGNSNLTISDLGEYPGNLSIRTLVVSGGSAGGPGSSYRESVFGAITNYTQVGGPGGPSGRASDSNVAASTFSVGNISVVVGAGGVASVGANSSFNNVAPTGNTISGASATFTESPSPYNRSESAGGGGFGAGGNGGDAVATSLTNVKGGQGGIGITSDITGTAITYACGGGGGGSTSGGLAGCTGAGNGGGEGNNGGNATANTGGGGGGGGPPALASIPDNTVVFSTGGNGGSGIVVVRYLTRYRNMALT